MKILLTGASGLIGREVGKLLVKDGHEVLALTRNAKQAVLGLPFQCQTLEWPGPSYPFPDDAASKLTGVQAVINLMGENISGGRWTPAFKESLYQSRVAGTQELITEVYRHASPSVWIQGSAIGIYGESKDGEAFTETSAPGLGFLAKLCVDWEQAVEGLPKGTRRVILRTGVVFSHTGGAFPKMLSPLLSGLGGVLGDGSQMMSLIHLVDVARFIKFAIKTDQCSGVYNLVSEQSLSQKNLVQRLCVLLNVSRGPSVPRTALKLAFGEMAEQVLFQSQNVVSERLSSSGFKLRYPGANELLAEVCSWHQHPLKPNTAVFIQYAEQFVPKPLNEVFPFFSEARNLEAITPEWLNFKIKNVSTAMIQKGTKILYRLKLHGVPMGWLTDIAEWQPPLLFVDNQLKGPYRLWYHEHSFEEVPGGTILRDWVRFQLPMGKIGQWFGLRKVRSDVSRIFEYRKEIIQEKFGS